MKTFEDFGIAVSDTAPLNDTTQGVDLAVATYNNLGLINDEGKAREAFEVAFGDLEAARENNPIIEPIDLVIVPKLGELTLGSLIDRYDSLTKQKNNPATWIYNELWDQYSGDELSQGQTRPMEAQAVLLGGTDNAYSKVGLYSTNQTLKDQRKSLKQAQKGHVGQDTILKSVSPASYIIRNAMQLERGKPLQDTQTFTRFVELDSKTAGGDSFVPVACSDGGLLDLYGSNGRADSYFGVRLAVGLK